MLSGYNIIIILMCACGAFFLSIWLKYVMINCFNKFSVGCAGNDLYAGPRHKHRLTHYQNEFLHTNASFNHLFCRLKIVLVVKFKKKKYFFIFLIFCVRAHALEKQVVTEARCDDFCKCELFISFRCIIFRWMLIFQKNFFVYSYAQIAQN